MDNTIDEDRLYRCIGERLKAQRSQLGITQGQLAKQSGVVRTSVTNIEAGLQRPPIHLLYQLCQALGLDINTILPPISEVRTKELEEVKIDGQSELMPPKAASLARELLDDLSREQ